MRRPGTLRGRLVLSALGTSALAVVVLTTLLTVVLDHRLGAEARNILRDRAGAAASTIRIAADGTVVLQDLPDDLELDTGV